MAKSNKPQEALAEQQQIDQIQQLNENLEKFFEGTQMSKFIVIFYHCIE
jgi:hypothetical protein